MNRKKRYGNFKKKHYVRIVNDVRHYLCVKFGYKRKPYVFETKLPKNEFMLFTHIAKNYIIFYDYKQFKESFKNSDFFTQEAYAAAIMAHEMRHYYQHRQMTAKKPKEKAETIALWIDNENNPKNVKDCRSVSEFYLQPLELDATLFGYTFAAEIFHVLLPQTVNDVEHFQAIEKLYITYFGKTNTDLFNDEIREILEK